MQAADGYSLAESISLQPCPCSTPATSPLLPELHTCSSNVLACAAEQLHVVMVPYPVQGQIIPMTHFAHLLAARQDANIRVTMVHNQHNYTRIHDVMHTHDTAPAASTAATSHAPSHRSVQLTWIENELPPDFDYNDISGSAKGMEFHLSTVHMKEPLKQLLQHLQQQGTPASCVLFGTFCPSALHSAATELRIPTRLFWTQSLSAFSAFYHMPLLVANGFFPYNKKNLPECSCSNRDVDTADMVTYIPGLPPLRPSSFPTLLQVDDFDGDPTIAILKEQVSIAGHCGGIIFNSFDELEKDACQALKQELPCPVSLVGPLLPSAFLELDDASNPSSMGTSCLLVENSECIKWLDGKQKHSILYIAFGSMFNPSADELQSIALGIKSSRQPYLWVIRPNPSFQVVSDFLPNGFVEDTKDFGLIITWAPQLQVLSHPSVGAFLTHCGWNSTLESLSMGMPMISLPLRIDQPMNSTYVCDLWKVGVALERQADGKVRSEDVEKAMRTVLHEEEGLKMRERAGKLRDAARRAVRIHGSSYVQVDNFIQALRNHAATPNMCSRSS